MFQMKNRVFYGECWCPADLEDNVRKVLGNLEKDYPNLPAGQLRHFEGTSTHPDKQTPPTYFRLNDFTRPFQEIVDTYGTPTYKEANPALFT